MKYLSILDHHGKRIPVKASGYQGGASGRRMGAWTPSSAGPSSVVTNTLSSLRSRSRDLIRNNPLADGGVDDYVATVIGTGLKPRWYKLDTKEREIMQDHWRDWCEEADVYGRLSFYGLQSIVVRGLVDAGESLIRIIRSTVKSTDKFPLKLQVLEADHLDEKYSVSVGDTKIRMGIEINDYGIPEAYHLWREHPGESFIGKNLERMRVPADDLMHVFKVLRAGQLRGRPGFSSVIVKLYDLDQYDDAELVRKKGAAMFGGFLYEEEKSDQYPDPSEFLGRKDGTDDEGQDIIAFEPGTFPRLPKGLKVEFSKPADVGSMYEGWMKKQLRDIAKGFGLTYDMFTGDLSNVNFSSIRVGLNALKRRVTQFQQEVVIFQMNRRVMKEFLRAMVLTGRLGIREYERNARKYSDVLWTPDRWPSANPYQDAQMDLLEVQAGFASRSKKVMERGEDVEKVDREQQEDLARERETGVNYSSTVAQGGGVSDE